MYLGISLQETLLRPLPLINHDITMRNNMVSKLRSERAKQKEGNMKTKSNWFHSIREFMVLDVCI